VKTRRDKCEHCANQMCENQVFCVFCIAGTLATQLENENHLDYAGMCCLSVAKCEQSLANLPGETAALVRASRLFLRAEKNIYKLDCPSFEESLNVSVFISKVWLLIFIS
jgi:hypothetical protein